MLGDTTVDLYLPTYLLRTCTEVDTDREPKLMRQRTTNYFTLAAVATLFLTGMQIIQRGQPKWPYHSNTLVETSATSN